MTAAADALPLESAQSNHAPTAMNLRLPAVLAFAAILPASAAEPGERNLPLWEAGVGAAVFSTPAYPGAAQRSNRVLAVPYLLYRGRILRADQEGVGARLVDNDRITFDVGFAASLPAHSKDVDARRGMPDLGTLVEFGPRVKYRFADLGEAGRWRVELPLRTVIEARGGLRRQGWTVEPRLVWEQRGERGRWTVDAQLGAVFGDRRINGYFYDVAPQYATAARPAYRAEGGPMLVRTGLAGTWKLNPDVRLFSFVRLDSHAVSSNRDSPLFRKDSGVSAGFGFAWTLARSGARAAD
jgi:outer membrane scaffolding protein for murein synthesis (MipA/OmpV family)